MDKIIARISEELEKAFAAAGYDRKYAVVRNSDRPDLGDFQCNGAMAAAKEYHKAPIMIAEDVIAKTAESTVFQSEAVKPGFINIRVAPEALVSYLREMEEDEHLSVPQEEHPKKIVIDYGGPNVAKPLHVGHLRSAVIGESVKRLVRAVGNEVLGDVHLGDWGLQIGLIITELQERRPELPYFSEDENAAYPEEAPFTISELEEIYPTASAKSKEDEAFRDRAMQATHELQEGRPGYRALWKKIMEVSVADLKRNYHRLSVDFDLWKAESDVQEYIPQIVADLKDRELAHEDQGALVVDVSDESDKKQIPPCIILKSDGAALYATTDIATIYEREKLFKPDQIIYVVDKRQSMHFVQVFRTVRKAGYINESTELTHVGFGTMNGKDGKPFKTRDGGVMRLENLLNDIEKEMQVKISDNRNVKEEDAAETAKIVSLAALKYGDLSNQASKDYIFDVDKFTSFEGNTGPYILYTIVRIKSILERAEAKDREAAEKAAALLETNTAEQRALMLSLTQFGSVIEDAYRDLAPHKICAYIFELSNEFNRFYHETKILSEADEAMRRSYLNLLVLTGNVLEKCIDILGFSSPEHM
ncbi:MAG: arginine--tRNA ligase [Lachnospiraceae bacterium]|nr:arginine--tRNA ligase [Lachnospiraceae bacterium]